LSEEYVQKLKQIGDTLKIESAKARAAATPPSSPQPAGNANQENADVVSESGSTTIDAPQIGGVNSSFTSITRSSSLSTSIKETPPNPLGKATVQQASRSSSPTTSTSSPTTTTTSSPWIISSNEISFSCKLGVGSSAKVYKGKYRNQEVAIKVLRTMPDNRQIQDFQKEFQIMR
jgi:hypothetical protein